MAMQCCWPIINVPAAFMCINASNDIATTSKTWSSTECEWCLVLHLGYRISNAVGLTHNLHMCSLYGQRWQWQYRYYLLKMSISGATMMTGVASGIIKRQCNGDNPWLNDWPPLGAKLLVRRSLLPRKSELQQSVNDVWSCILIIKGLFNSINPESNYRPPLSAKMLVPTLQPPPDNVRQRKC